MLNSETFQLGDYTFTFTPLRLRQARKLYKDLLHHYGGVFSAFTKHFKIDTGKSLFEQNVEVLSNDAIAGLGEMLTELTLSFDDEWYSDVMQNVILPNLEIAHKDHKIPKEDKKGWYEIEFAQQCVLDLKVFINCVQIQYKDFFVLLRGAKNMIEQIKKTIKH